MCTIAIEDTIPINAPTASNHAVVVILIGRRQLRQIPPLGPLALLSTCMGTDRVLVHDGLLLSVAVKLTMSV